MQSSTRIDELRARFHENPRRYFAPLANEYRKAGDPEQAIAICRAHLAQQPGHMSGHVVCAQALFDAQRTDEARTVFEQALALDPDNVIVLRHLGDIARQRGETAEARHWYTRGLNSDPHDTEIAAYLAELTEPLAIAAAPSSAPGSPVDAEAGAESTGALVGAPVEEPAAVARESSDDVEGVNEALLAEDVDAVPRIQPEVEVEAVRESVHEMELLDAPSPEAGVESMGDARPDLDVEPVDPAVSTIPRERGPFVTSTMAELYIQQGFKAQAIEIYRQLASERPDDREIADRLSALSVADDAIEPEGESATNEQFEDATESKSTALPADELGSPTPSAESHFTETELVGGGDSWDTDNWAAGFSSSDAVDYGDLHSPDVESGSGNAAGAEFLADAGKLDTNLIADMWGEADAVADLAVAQSDSRPVADLGVAQSDSKPVEDLGVAQSDSDLVAYAPLTPTLFGGSDTPDRGHADADQVTDSDFDGNGEVEADGRFHPGDDSVAVEASGGLSPDDGESETAGDPDTPLFDERMPERGPTIREFFATLGAKRPPGHAAPDGQVAGDLAPPLAGAFDDLFPGEVISGEDSRAAFALSGAVGGPLPTSAPAVTTEMPHSKAAAGASPPREGYPHPAAAPAMPSSAEAGQESEEDIRKFREWLDGLAQS